MLSEMMNISVNVFNCLHPQLESVDLQIPDQTAGPDGVYIFEVTT